jgi:hypothetical protein
MRKGRWIPVALALLALGPLLYVFSFGPACWITSQRVGGGVVEPSRAMILYWPLGAVAGDVNSASGRYVRWWMTLGVRKGQSVVVPTSPRGNALILETD